MRIDRLTEDGSGTAHRVAVAVLTVPPHTAGPPPHWHQKHDETFHVIAGNPRFTVGDTQHEAPAGTFVSVPIGAEHTFANPGDEPAIILNTFTPDLYVSYFRDLAKLQASGGMTPEAILAVMARYATYPAGIPAPDEPEAKEVKASWPPTVDVLSRRTMPTWTEPLSFGRMPPEAPSMRLWS